MSGGYVDGVTDDRQPHYIRFYCGQSSRLPMRVAKEHAGEIRNRTTNKLHYFVLARGQGHRTANFLLLWSAPEQGSTKPGSNQSAGNEAAGARFSMKQSVLEMTFCRAFESLADAALNPYFGHAEYSNVGLNNLLPLFGSQNIKGHKRVKYLDYLKQSPDPDISAYVDIRRRQLDKLRNSKRQFRAIRKEDYFQNIVQLAKSNKLDPMPLKSAALAPKEPRAAYDTFLPRPSLSLAPSRCWRQTFPPSDSNHSRTPKAIPGRR